MEKRVTVVDYGLGNLFSIMRALTHVGAHVDITSNPEAIPRTQRLILPGVGAFGDGMLQLRSRGLIEPIQQVALAGRPLLGICLGMQLLFSRSEEFGPHEGLGLIKGKVVRLRDTDPTGNRVKVPHVGWSELKPRVSLRDWGSTVLEGLAEGEAMYFVHSFVPCPEEPVAIAQNAYGGYSYCAVVEKGNIIGFQCHPEKSGEVGLEALRNFLKR